MHKIKNEAMWRLECLQPCSTPMDVIVINLGDMATGDVGDCPDFLQYLLGDGPTVTNESAFGVKNVSWSLKVSNESPSKGDPDRTLICVQAQGKAGAKRSTTKCIEIPADLMLINSFSSHAGNS